MRETGAENLEHPKPQEWEMPSNLYIVWSRKQHITKVPIIDEQHRALVSTINSLFFLSRNHHPAKAILLTLGVLQAFAETHFVTEEILMELTGYPHLEEHKKIMKYYAPD